MSVLHIGLCDGRHPLIQNASLLDANGTYQPNPTVGEDMDLFVFPAEVDDPLSFDKFREIMYKFSQKYINDDDNTLDNYYEDGNLHKVYLYVTGLTPLLTSFLWVWIHDNDYGYSKVPLVLMHYDRDTGQYKEEYWG